MIANIIMVKNNRNKVFDNKNPRYQKNKQVKALMQKYYHFKHVLKVHIDLFKSLSEIFKVFKGSV